jgi:CRP/FNR family transcriptional regulator, cyclic AMP receptor protein
MEIGTLEPILREHVFFRDLPSKYFDFIVGCASNVVFKPDDLILREGEPADKFYLIRNGRVAILIEHPGPIIIQTIGGGDILGWSWLVPPYSYRFSAKAVENTRAVALDGKCFREKCEKNPDLGYEVLKRLVKVLTGRLEATRLQLLDIHGNKGGQ